MTCPKCGAPRPVGAAECPQCGIIYARFEQRRANEQQQARERQAQLEAIRASAMIDCPMCGNRVSRLAQACPHCGHPIFGTVPLPPVVEQARTRKSLGTRIKYGIYICAGLFLLYGFAISMFSGSGGSGVNTSPAQSRSESPVGTRTINKDTMGCRNLEDLKRLTDLAVARDREAFSRAMLNYTAAGRCRLFRGGETAYVEDSKLLQGAIKVRVAGETASWWISL